MSLTRILKTASTSLWSARANCRLSQVLFWQLKTRENILHEGIQAVRTESKTSSFTLCMLPILPVRPGLQNKGENEGSVTCYDIFWLLNSCHIVDSSLIHCKKHCKYSAKVPWSWERHLFILPLHKPRPEISNSHLVHHAGMRNSYWLIKFTQIYWAPVLGIWDSVPRSCGFGVRTRGQTSLQNWEDSFRKCM